MNCLWLQIRLRHEGVESSGLQLWLCFLGHKSMLCRGFSAIFTSARSFSRLFKRTGTSMSGIKVSNRRWNNWIINIHLPAYCENIYTFSPFLGMLNRTSSWMMTCCGRKAIKTGIMRIQTRQLSELSIVPGESKLQSYFTIGDLYHEREKFATLISYDGLVSAKSIIMFPSPTCSRTFYEQASDCARESLFSIFMHILSLFYFLSRFHVALLLNFPRNRSSQNRFAKS